MTNLIRNFRERFTKVSPLPEGLHHLQIASQGTSAYRLHLRLMKDGTGLLVVNASTVLHLNPTAAEYAYHFIKGTEPEQAAQSIAARYRVSRKQAFQDMLDFNERIETLIHTPDLDPVTFLDFERVSPHSQDLNAPLRLDCALTYRLPPGADKSASPTKRVKNELSTDQWKSILDKAWHEAIPHIIFTGGEPTLREDLPELIAHTEKNGQVSGLISDGLKLANKDYLTTLLVSGLDHLMVVLQPDNKKSWKALETVMPEDLFTTVHLTVSSENIKDTEKVLQRLVVLEVKSLSLSTADKKAGQALADVRDRAAELQLNLTWDLPVPYSAQNPVSLETVEDNVPNGAGKAWLYVEPDGDVLPAQGMPGIILGNILEDPWEKIYIQ